MSVLSAADFVVIGGGTAGVVAAVRLAERAPSAAVCLIEAGPSDRGVDVIQSLPRWAELLGGTYDYDFEIAPQARGNSRMRHSRGKMLGGCSSHNSCIAFVPPDVDFASWGMTWSAADCRPAYQRVLDTVSLELADTGNELVEAFLESCATAGVARTDFTRPFDGGAGWFRLNKRGTTRASTSNAYLHNRTPPPNLTVHTGVHVERIELTGTRATAVRTDAGRVEVGREVVLCAGAFGSPQLLMCSGIGPADHLRGHGIAPQVDLEGVGENLVDHPEGVLIFETRHAVPPEQVQRYEAGAFIRVDGDAPWPDLMFHFGLEAFDMNTLPAGFPTSRNAFSLTPNVTRARSRGTVRLAAADTRTPPIIDFGYFTDPEGYDERIMVEGARWARRIASEAPLADWVQRELAPGPTIQDDRDLSAYLRGTGNTVYHPAGTCALGSVVDENLRVRGIDALRVADASIFPQMISVNPGITVMMIGERLAELCTVGR